MIENLLWPKKLTEPPQLLVDVETLFHKGGNLDTSLVGFVGNSSMDKAMNYRLISVGGDGPDTFRIGFIADVTGITRLDYVMAALALPFQDLETEIMWFMCHGWTQAGADILSTTDKTVEKGSLSNSPDVLQAPMQSPTGHEYLFKMESSEFEGNGSGNKFSSAGSGYSIYYDYMNRNGDLKSEFPEIFNNYATVALETVVKVKVYSSAFPDGFRLGTDPRFTPPPS